MRTILMVGLLWLSTGMAAEPRDIPPALRDWSAWVLHGQERQTCPNITPREGQREPVCAWPGVLKIEADARSARFTQTWDMTVADRIALPGSADLQPEAVQIDGRAAPVLMQGRYGGPMLHLPAGRHTVSGRIVWSERPASVAVPPTALVELTVDGRRIALPQRDDAGALLLGAAEKHEADALSLNAARLLHDDMPAQLTTWIELYVSGKAREISLGKVLPKGWTLVALGGELSARITADGTLIVQALPGDYELALTARAPSALETLQIEPVGEPWPEQEPLQFLAVPRFRVSRLEGLPALDPEQAILPDWSSVGELLFPRDRSLAERFDDAEHLPTFLLEAGPTATIEARQRGLPAERPPQLRLERELWLDFDGGGYAARDRISGELGSLRRIDMAAPWALQSARANERQQLITRTPDADTAGIELRHPRIELEAQARAATADLPGWTQGFDSADFVLNVPPGWRLLGATGPERAYGSWWDAWTLLDLFLSSLAVVMAWRLGRWPAAAAMFAWVLLFWNHAGAPHLLWLFALALALLLRAIGEGRWHSRLGWLQRLLLLGIVLQGLPFVASELRMALHPQLEPTRGWATQFAESPRRAKLAQDATVVYEEATPMAIEAPPPAAAPAPPPPGKAEGRVMDKSTSLEGVMVTGSRIDPNDQFELPADAIPQAGEAQPDWQWNLYRLSWAGPLRPDDRLGLVLSPPWLTRLWHLAGLGLLLALLWQLRGSAGIAMPRRAPLPSAALLLLALTGATLAPAPAQAQGDLPSQALLDQLRQRLLEPDPRCGDSCVHLGVAQLQVTGAELHLRVEAEATATGTLPLPQLEGGVLIGAALDARPVGVATVSDGRYIVVEEGKHSLELRWRLTPERLSLRFALRPVRISVQAPGYDVSGLDRERLSGASLSLAPRASAAPQGGTTAPGPAAAVQVAPFVHVERRFTFDREWSIDTTVSRIAPSEAGFGLALPPLPGEQVLPGYANEPPPQLENGQLRINFPAGESSVRWNSRLPATGSLELTAPSRADLFETWSVTVSPLLHASAEGVPSSLDDHGRIDDFGVWHFLPLPGETLRVTLQRPAALAGHDQAIDRVELSGSHGNRSSRWQLQFTLRATRAGEMRLPLPEGAVLQALMVDGRPLPTLLDDGAVNLPVGIGEQEVAMSWQLDAERGSVLRTPALNLGRSSANVHYTVEVPKDRWLLFTTGPGIGPAVLLWGELLVMAVLAWLLGRWPGTPLRSWHWLLLGLGFAMVSWAALVLVAGWLLALGARRRMPLNERSKYTAWATQIGLILITIAAIATLITAVPAGLLGSPDMGVTGNGSNARQLRWLLDRSVDGSLPTAAAWTLPLWAYKAAVLLWAMWLAGALVGWLRWGWQCAGVGGYWPARPAPANPTTSPDPAGNRHDPDDR